MHTHSYSLAEVNVKGLCNGQALGTKRLVDLNLINVVDGLASLGQQTLRGRDRTNAHNLKNQKEKGKEKNVGEKDNVVGLGTVAAVAAAAACVRGWSYRGFDTSNRPPNDAGEGLKVVLLHSLGIGDEERCSAVTNTRGRGCTARTETDREKEREGGGTHTHKHKHTHKTHTHTQDTCKVQVSNRRGGEESQGEMPHAHKDTARGVNPNQQSRRRPS